MDGHDAEVGGGIAFDREQAESFLLWAFYSHEGLAVVGYGRDGYVNEHGKYVFAGGFTHTFYGHPEEFDRLLGDVAREMAVGGVDIYVCPLLRSEPKRAKGNAVSHSLLWADSDADTPLDLALVADLGEVAIVDSGTPGHEHVYVKLADNPGAEERERLARALAARLGDCDPKFADNDVLRLPGTVNGKHGRAVTIRHSQAGALDAATVAKLLDVSAPLAPGCLAPPTPAILPAEVAEVLARDTGDRSEDLHALMGACLRARLTSDRLLGVARQHPGAVEKYGPRLADEVQRCWLKVVDDEQRLMAAPTPLPVNPNGTAAATITSTGDPTLDLALAHERRTRWVRQYVRAEEANALFQAPPEPVNLAAEVVEEEPAPVVEEMIHEGAVANVRSVFKGGKTTFGVSLLKTLADGEPFLGRYKVPTPRRVFVMNFEMPPGKFRKWLLATRIVHRDAVAVLNLRGAVNPLSSEAGRAWVAERMRAHRADVLLIDPLGRALNGIPETSDPNDRAIRWAGDVEVMMAQAGVGVLVLLSHAGRVGEDTRGASFFDGWPDVLITITRGSGNDSDVRYLKAEGRDVDIPEGQLSYDPENHLLTMPEDAPDRYANRLDRLAEAVVAVVRAQPGIGRVELAKAVKGRNTDVHKAITQAINNVAIRVALEGATVAHYIVEPLTPLVPSGGQSDRGSPGSPRFPEPIGSEVPPPPIGGDRNCDWESLALGEPGNSSFGSPPPAGVPTDGVPLPDLFDDNDSVEMGYHCDLCPRQTSLRFWPYPHETTRCPEHPPGHSEVDVNHKINDRST